MPIYLLTSTAVVREHWRNEMARSLKYLMHKYEDLNSDPCSSHKSPHLALFL